MPTVPKHRLVGNVGSFNSGKSLIRPCTTFRTSGRAIALRLNAAPTHSTEYEIRSCLSCRLQGSVTCYAPELPHGGEQSDPCRDAVGTGYPPPRAGTCPQPHHPLRPTTPIFCLSEAASATCRGCPSMPTDLSTTRQRLHRRRVARLIQHERGKRLAATQVISATMGRYLQADLRTSPRTTSPNSQACVVAPPHSGTLSPRIQVAVRHGPLVDRNVLREEPAEPNMCSWCICVRDFK